ncbi:MAG TPA: hypothetical protein VF459_20150 [Caulobacteraceae bacterium]
MAGAALTACAGEPDAPTDVGVCWREVLDKAGKPHFEVIARNVANLDSCAAQIEGLHLQEQRDVVGAYQSFFITADDASVSSSSTQNGFRYPIFLPGQRETIDAGLRKLIDENHGQAPTGKDLDIGRQQ